MLYLMSQSAAAPSSPLCPGNALNGTIMQTSPANRHRLNNGSSPSFKHVSSILLSRLISNSSFVYSESITECFSSFLSKNPPKILYLFDLQAVAPYSLQQVTQASDECILLQPSDIRLTVAELYSLSTHLLHQHPLSLKPEHTSLIKTATSGEVLSFIKRLVDEISNKPH